MIRLAAYSILDLAASACLVGALALSAGTHEAILIGTAAGAGVAILGMAAMLIREEVRGRYRAAQFVAGAVPTES